MARHVWIAHLLGLLSILGGLLLLAFTQVAAVLPDPKRTELSDLEGSTLVGEVGGVVLGALFVTAGTTLILGFASPAPVMGRAAALGVLGVALPVYFVAQTLLFVNAAAAEAGGERWLQFKASYLFHSGGDITFLGNYILFMFNLVFLFLVLGAVGYLLAPGRFLRALFDRMSWAKNEAIHIAATLFLLLSLAVLFHYLLRIAGGANPGAYFGQGLVAQNLVTLYYLLAFVLAGLILTVAAHAFLLNWGVRGPFELTRVAEGIRTIARVERGLLLAACVLDLVILMAPSLPTEIALSQSFVFDITPRGLAFAFFLLLVPYLPYAASRRRLDFLLRAGRGPRTGGPFAEGSLRLVLAHVLGAALLVTWGVNTQWDPLGLLLALAGWTAAVLLFFALRVEVGPRLPRLALRPESGPPLYFVALGLTLTTGLMLWGSGNTFEVLYTPEMRNLQIVNESNYGLDLLARVSAAVVVLGSALLTVDLWLHSYGISRRLLHHYLSLFLLCTVAVLFAFTVGVWTQGERGLQDAYAGFAFHQYYGLESVGVALLLTGCVAYGAHAARRMFGPILDAERRFIAARRSRA